MCFIFGRPIDHPVVGDWNGDGIVSIGIYRNGRWTLDTNGDGSWTDADVERRFGRKGDVPIVGDWNGDGFDNLGVYRDGIFILDTNGNARLDAADARIVRGQPGDQPIAGDWNGDGRDEVGTHGIDFSPKEAPPNGARGGGCGT